jgi:hypothetical protein
MYFTRRNGLSRQFLFKLHNALRITLKFPQAYVFVGAIWVSPAVIKINAQAFAAFLGVKTVQGALFHKQGNFSRHGFTPVLRHGSADVITAADCEDVDDYNVRLYTDMSRKFLRDVEFRPNLATSARNSSPQDGLPIT